MTQAFNMKKQYWLEHYGGLPPEYRRVEYMESTKTQWIDTQIPCNQRIRLKFDVAFTDVSGAQTMGVGSQGSRANRCACGVVNGKFYAGIGNENILTAWPVDVGKLYRMFADVHTYTYGLNATTGSGGTSWEPVTTHLSLFTQSNIISDCPCACRLYGATLIGVSSVLRDFIPAVRISDSKPGMYDLCGSICPLTNSPFYINSGTGADFLWGEL